MTASEAGVLPLDDPGMVAEAGVEPALYGV